MMEFSEGAQPHDLRNFGKLFAKPVRLENAEWPVCHASLLLR
jgi:hypothetical protein